MSAIIKSVQIYFLGIHHDIAKRAFDRRVDKLIRGGQPITDRRTCLMADKCCLLRKRFEDASAGIDVIMQNNEFKKICTKYSE